jgi:hypothetical protein
MVSELHQTANRAHREAVSFTLFCQGRHHENTLFQSVGGDHPSDYQQNRHQKLIGTASGLTQVFAGSPGMSGANLRMAVLPKLFPVAPVRFRDTGAGSITFVEHLVVARPNQSRGLLAGTSEKIRLRASTDTPS